LTYSFCFTLEISPKLFISFPLLAWDAAVNKGLCKLRLVVSSCEIYFSFLLCLAPAGSPVWTDVPSSPGTAKDQGCKTPNLIVSAVPSLMLSRGDFYCDLHFRLVYHENI